MSQNLINAFNAGFIQKCAEHGIDPNDLIDAVTTIKTAEQRQKSAQGFTTSPMMGPYQAPSNNLFGRAINRANSGGTQIGNKDVARAAYSQGQRNLGGLADRGLGAAMAVGQGARSAGRNLGNTVGQAGGMAGDVAGAVGSQGKALAGQGARLAGQAGTAAYNAVGQGAEAVTQGATAALSAGKNLAGRIGGMFRRAPQRAIQAAGTAASLPGAIGNAAKSQFLGTQTGQNIRRDFNTGYNGR